MKKFLSLVLAVIMTMSLVTISAGATEYRDLTDKDEIQYEEAVAVLNRLGIITGYDDGSFRPDDELTRGAAAKIIVSLLIGPDAASGLTAPTAPYPDVPTTHTFAGVISFCKTSEIISGYGDGTFKPGNPLTGFAFAKMLLGALGYNSKIERFVDTGWTQNVAKVGNVAGLFDRLDFDGASAVNRETACQLALNTLKATMVTYGGTTVVTGANQQSYMVQGTQAMYVTSNNREINANINRRVINATNNEMTLEFGEEHFKDLRLEHDKYDPAYDIYGHPSNEWSYKKVTIGTFALEPDFKYTTQISHIEDTVATKEKALGLRGYDTYSTDHRANYTNWSSAAGGQYQYNSPFNDATQIHINGWNARVRNDDYSQGSYPANVDRDGQVYTYDASRIGASNKEEAPSLSEIADLTDNGVTVEVYVCPVDADFITDVVVTRTQLMKVDRITSDAIYMETITPDSTDVVRNAETLDEIAGYNDNALNKEVISVKDDNYDAYNALKDMKAGDRMAIIPYTADDGKTWEVGEAYQPETVSGVLTNVDIYNTSRKPDGNAVAITVGGTTYPIAQWNKDMIDVSGPQIKATRKDVTLYLDKLGNAMWADEIGNSDAWMIVGDYYQATGVSSRVDWFVHGWTISGEEIDLDLGTIRGEAEKYAPGELVRYAISDGGNGEYTLTKPNYNGEYVLKQDYNQAKYDANAMFSNGRSSEQPLLKDGESTGEGIYTVAQYAYQTGTNNSVQYNIKKGNDYIPLDRYNTQRDSANAPATVTGIRLNYSAVDSQNGISYNTTNDTVTAPATFAADWTYKIAPYDGVKFIFVGFDSSTGEVDTIDVVDGPVNVDYSDLIQINRYWRNVGTNVDNWVASPAEAYVNDKGLVKAVVIKNDAAEPSMSDYYIITDNKGSDTVVKSTGADAPTSGTYYTRQYVCGADGFKEEKTGYFDKALEVGTIITGRLGSDGVIKSRVFHANEYTNKNPDALYIKGIGRVMTLNNKVSESSFVVGSSTGNIVATVGTGRGYGHTLTENGCDILGDEIVMGDTAVSNHKGLIKVDSATQFIDLRPGRPGDIKDLGDLLDYNNDSNVILKVLLNGNKSSDGFRRAYAVVILNATTAGANDVVIGSGSLMPVTDNNSGFVYAIRTPDGSTNGIRYTTIAGLQRDLKVGDIVEIFVKDGFSIQVDPAGRPGPGNNGGTELTIPGDSPVPVVISKDSGTTNPEPVTVTINNSTGDIVTVSFTDPNGNVTSSQTSTVTLTKGTKYTVSVPDGYTVDLPQITAGTNDSVTVTKVQTPGDEVNISISGTAGQTVTFTNAQDSTDTLTVTIGEDGSALAPLASGKIMNVSANTEGFYAKASSVALQMPYGKNFTVSSDIKIEVYKAGQSMLVPALTYDNQVGAASIPAVDTSAQAESLDDVVYRSSLQNAAPYFITSVGDVFILWESGTGLNEGMLLMHPDTLKDVGQDGINTIFQAMNNGGVTADTISSETFDEGYSSEIPPTPSASEGVKATYNSGATPQTTFAAYWGADATVAPELTEDQVKAAIGAVLNETVVSIDLAKGKATTGEGREVTFAGTVEPGATKTAGSYQNPNRLYKVTIGSNEYYAASEGSLEGIDKNLETYLLPKDTVAEAAADILNGSTGTVANVGILTEDIELVSAVLFKGTASGAAPGGTPADPSGVKIYAAPAGKAPILLSQSTSTANSKQYVQKGTPLIVKGDDGASDAGKEVTVTVNGAKKTGTLDKNGEFQFTFADGNPACDLIIDVTLGSAAYTVTYNGEVLSAEAKEGDQFWISDLDNTQLIREDADNDKFVVATGAKSAAKGVYYEVTARDATKSGGKEINLFKGYTVNPGDVTTWTVGTGLDSDGETLTGTISKPSGDAAPTVVKAGSTVYVKASAAATSLKVDTDEAPTLVLNRVGNYLMDKPIIYSATVTENVTADSIEVDINLSSVDVDYGQGKTTLTAIAAPAAGSTANVSFTLSGVTGVSKSSTISAHWQQDGTDKGLDNSNTKVEYSEAGKVSVSSVTSGALGGGGTADTEVTLTLTVDGISKDVTVKFSK